MAGDPSTIPDGYVRQLSNMLVRPGPRFDSRPPAVYDGLSSINGLAKWEDLVNQVTRFIALDSSKLYKKATSGEAWDAGTSGLTVTRLTSYENYRGKLYMMFDDGAGSPSVAAVYDGTNLSVTPFDSPIVARKVVTYGDRLFFFYPRVTVTPLDCAANDPTNLYDWSGASFVKSGSVSVKNITFAAGVTECQVFPTSTTGTNNWVRHALTVVPSTTVDDKMFLTWRMDLKNLDATTSIPLILKIGIRLTILRTTAYVVGEVYADASYNALWRCTKAGTTAGGAPAYPATLGTTVVDGTAEFTSFILGGLDGSARGFVPVASQPITLPDATSSPDFSTFFVTAKLPQWTNPGGLSGSSIVWMLGFWNTEADTLPSLAGVSVSLKDGIADGDARKKNRGGQVTVGSFYVPFVNTETAITATINLESTVWSETSSVPPIIRAANTYEPKEAAGLPTDGIVVQRRLVMFKRRAIWVFTLTPDPDNPIIEESIRVGVGGISPMGSDKLDDEVFFVGENECYRMKIGDAPQPFAGDAMREEMFAKGANWVESQSTYNLARLAIDQKNREVWVYTQKGKLYVFNLATSAWSTCDIQSQEVAAMAYNPSTTKMEISLGGKGLVRLDDTTTAQDTIDNTGTLYLVIKTIILRPFELYHPRAELCLHEVGIFHLATAAQTTESLFVLTSNDRGTTFPHFMDVRFDPTIERVPLTLYQFGVSVMPAIVHYGSAGRAAWSLSKAEALIELLSGEWPRTQPTQLGSSL